MNAIEVKKGIVRKKIEKRKWNIRNRSQIYAVFQHLIF